MKHIFRFALVTIVTFIVLFTFSSGGLGGKIYANNVINGSEDFTIETAINHASRHIKQQKELANNNVGSNATPSGDMPQLVNAPQAKEHQWQAQKSEWQVKKQEPLNRKNQQAKQKPKHQKKSKHHRKPNNKLATRNARSHPAKKVIKHHKPQQKQLVTNSDDKPKSNIKQTLTSENSCQKIGDDGRTYLTASADCDRYLSKIESEEKVDGELYLQAYNGCTTYNAKDKRQYAGGICHQLIAVTGYIPDEGITETEQQIAEEKDIMKQRIPKAHKAVIQWEKHKASKPKTQLASWDNPPAKKKQPQGCADVLWKDKQITTKYPWTAQQKALLATCKGKG